MRYPRIRQAGFTLVELMIACAIGLLVLAGMTTMFVSSNHAQAEIEKSNRQIENGRYGIQLLGEDLRNAGFYGQFDPTVMAMPAAVPDPCSTDLAEIRAALPLAVQGYDNVAGGTLGCVTDVRVGTDIVVVRHASTCTIDAASCEVNSAGAPYFQASLCNNLTELGSGSVADYFAVDALTANLTRHLRDCSQVAGSGTLAPLRYLLVHIYYVANNDRSGDGVPTLKRAELSNNAGALSLVTVPLVAGVENMQLEYGLDSDNDGAADDYTAAPAGYGGCGLAACQVTNWGSVVSARLHLLTRNTQATAGYADDKSYVLGQNADGSENAVAGSGNYKRHVFQSTVLLPNPAGRRTP